MLAVVVVQLEAVDLKEEEVKTELLVIKEVFAIAGPELYHSRARANPGVSMVQLWYSCKRTMLSVFVDYGSVGRGGKISNFSRQTTISG